MQLAPRWGEHHSNPFCHYVILYILSSAAAGLPRSFYFILAIMFKAFNLSGPLDFLPFHIVAFCFIPTSFQMCRKQRGTLHLCSTNKSQIRHKYWTVHTQVNFVSFLAYLANLTIAWLQWRTSAKSFCLSTSRRNWLLDFSTSRSFELEMSVPLMSSSKAGKTFVKHNHL